MTIDDHEGEHVGALLVRDLIALLQQQDPNAPVEVEGCDCTGDASGVLVNADGSVLIERFT